MPVVQPWLIKNISYLRYDFSFTNAALSGHNVWSNLVRLTRDALANDPQVYILDHANGILNEETMEAIIRRVWTANPTTRIVLIEAPTWGSIDYHDNANVVNPTNQAAMATVNALASYYGIPIVPVWTWAKSVVPGTYDLDEIFPDGVHPNFATTYNFIAGEIETYLTQSLTYSGSLPARLYDSADYENESTIKNGTDYDGRTGTWTDTGTRTESNEVGATITYSATCQSFGGYRADGGSNDVEISIDGGAYSAMSFYQNGRVVGAGRGAHTIAIKVMSGTVRIDEFWAV